MFQTVTDDTGYGGRTCSYSTICNVTMSGITIKCSKNDLCNNSMELIIKPVAFILTVFSVLTFLNH